MKLKIPKILDIESLKTMHIPTQECRESSVSVISATAISGRDTSGADICKQNDKLLAGETRLGPLFSFV